MHLIKICNILTLEYIYIGCIWWMGIHDFNVHRNKMNYIANQVKSSRRFNL